MTKTLLVFISAIPFLFSCNNNNTQERFRLIDESLRRSNAILLNEHARLYDETEEKMHSPETVAKAGLWKPKMDEVKNITASVSSYIDSLETALEITSGNDAGPQVETYSETDKEIVRLLFGKQQQAAKLFDRLKACRKSLIDVIKSEEFSENPDLQKRLLAKKTDFEHSMVSLGDSGLIKSTSTHFKDATAMEAVTMLDKMKNDFLYDAYLMLDYCESQTAGSRDNYYQQFSAILTKSTNYLKEGEQLEIYAGIGSFSDAMRPTFIVNGTIVPVIDGRITYQLKAKGKPGKYNVPVTIKFTQPDGSLKTYNENVDYTVIP